MSAKGGKMVESDEQPKRDSGGGGGGAAMAALHQCELIQNMIEISISSLQGLRTKCAASNDLTQQEIRTLEVTSFSNMSELSPARESRRVKLRSHEAQKNPTMSASYRLNIACKRGALFLSVSKMSTFCRSLSIRMGRCIEVKMARKYLSLEA